MEQKNSRLVLIHVRLPAAINEPQPKTDARLPTIGNTQVWLDLDHELDRELDACAGKFFKLSSGTYLADESECFPAILQILELCARQKVLCFVVPVSEAPLTCPPFKELTAFLNQRGIDYRLTQFPPPEATLVGFGKPKI